MAPLHLAHHDVTAVEAETELTQQGFSTSSRDERFIDRPADDGGVWWLAMFQKP